MTFPRLTHARARIAAAFVVVAAGGFVWAQRSGMNESVFSRVAAMVRLPPVDVPDHPDFEEDQSLLTDPDDVRALTPADNPPKDLLDHPKAHPAGAGEFASHRSA